MIAAQWHKKHWVVLFTAALFLVGLFLYYRDVDKVALITAFLCGLVLLTGVLLFRTYSFYLALIALIPLSLDAGLAGGAQVNVPSEAMLIMLLGVLLFFHRDFGHTVKKVLTHPIAIFLAIDLMIQVITTLTSSHPEVSAKRLLIRLIFILGFFVTVNSLKDSRKILRVWLAYMIGALPVIYFTFRTFSRLDFDTRAVFVISKPYYTDHTLFGACMAFIIPLLVLMWFNRKRLNWQLWQRIGLGITLLLVLGAEIIALSRAALLSLIVALIFGLLVRYGIKFRTILIGLVITTVAIVVSWGSIYQYLERNDAVSNDGKISNHLSSVTNVQTDASNMERVNRWICALRMFEDKPLVGFGPGTYQFEYNRFQTIEHKTYISTNSGDKGNAHSEYLTYLSENGIFGAIIFLLTVFGAVYYGMRNHSQLTDPFLRMLNLGVLLGLVTYFFHGVFNAFMDQSKMAFLYFTALGTIVWISQHIAKRSAQETA